MSGNNRIVGTDQADEFRFGGGSVIYYGGLGNDWIWVEGGITKNCFFYGGEGDDRITVRGFTSTYSTYENIYINGGVGNDTIELQYSGGRNTVFGGAGDDYIAVTGAVGSDDRIYGGDGHDKIVYCGAGATGEIYGGNGNDKIQVFQTNVTVSGGSGADEFSFLKVNLSSTGNHIKDFSHSSGDYITLILDSRFDTKTMKYDVSTGDVYCNSIYGGNAHYTLVTLDNKPSDFSISSDVRVIPV